MANALVECPSITQHSLDWACSLVGQTGREGVGMEKELFSASAHSRIT